MKPEAQLTVASALFVNPTGRADGWFAADLACEFVNRYIKDQWSHRRKSTLSVRELSEFCTLNAIFFHPLREHLNKTWGRTIRPRHTSAARGAVIGRLASYLLKTVTYDGSRSSITVPGVNITRDYACKILIKQLMSFNIKFLQSARGDGEDIDDEEKEEEIQISLEIPMLYDQEQGYDEGADEEAEDMADFIDQWAAMDEE